MTPVLNAQVGSPEERYNFRQASARNCVERCNGVLKTRFRCLLGERKLRYLPQKVGTIIIACAVLHNLCIAVNLEIQVNENIEVNDNYHVPQLNNNQGNDARNLLIARYFTN